MIELRELEQAIRTLPREALVELTHFAHYLQYKYQTPQQGEIAQLGGLWTNINLDVSDEDVRALRSQAGAHRVPQP